MGGATYFLENEPFIFEGGYTSSGKHYHDLSFWIVVVMVGLHV